MSRKLLDSSRHHIKLIDALPRTDIYISLLKFSDLIMFNKEYYIITEIYDEEDGIRWREYRKMIVDIVTSSKIYKVKCK